MSEEYFKEVHRDFRRRTDWRLKNGMQANGDLYKDGVKIDHKRGPNSYTPYNAARTDSFGGGDGCDRAGGES
jgi:hypothetical protein